MGNSIPVPRVSDVLKVLYPNSLDFVPQEALERGSRLHELVEIWINNVLQGYQSDDPLDPAVAPVIEWFQKQDIVFERTEDRVWHKLGFLGTPDILFTWRKIPYWADLKFADVITEQNLMQGEAYRHLTGRRGVFIQCTRTGKLVIHRARARLDLWADFLAGLHVWRFQQMRVKPAKVIPEELQTTIEEVREALWKAQDH